MKKILSLIIALVLLMSLAAVNAKEANEPNAVSMPRIVISGTGDSHDLLLAIANAMMAKVGGVQIELLESIGSTAGIKAVAAGKADLARVARPLKEHEKEFGLTQQVFANTPVVFAASPDINGIDNITTEQILGIYSGKITDWSQLGAKPGKIYPLTREQGDSALRILNEMLPGFADINNPNAKVMYLTPETVATLQEHKQTIGFVPLSATVNANLKILNIDGIEPSIKKVLSGDYKYLIPLGVVYKDQPKGLAKEFIDFLYSEDAKKIIKTMGAVPVK
ncbi:MAG: substrate-binding domain-containing protein [Phycisphaerae bacterium]|jgi:phosphate transport system substrate-binding protein